MSDVVDKLQLRGKAKLAAEEFHAAFPTAVFTSGRRTLEEQASAMASNITMTRLFIAQTYKSSKVSKALHAWVVAHPEAKTKSAIATGLYLRMKDFTDEELSALSLHLSGDAFDVQPVKGLLGGQMATFLYELCDRYGGVFLEREAGLLRWHAQFRE